MTETAYVTTTRTVSSSTTSWPSAADAATSGAPVPPASSPVSSSSSTTTTNTYVSSTYASSAEASASPAAYPWVRDSYYNAGTGEADNIIFTNHLGGTNGSGTWDSCFGNSLSYANTDGATAAAIPQVLGNVQIASDQEVVLFTSSNCGGSCGYVRSGTPAYYGFDTSSDTIFLFEFTMPHDGNTGFNGDMPAVWMLNAQIPRTLQYGSPSCSCWTSGCGEFDIFEVLSTGCDYLTTTLHSYQGTGTQYGGGGSSDYIPRPTSSPMQAAVIFCADSQTLNIIALGTSGAFADGLTQAQVDQWLATSGASVNIAAGG